jgi:sulfate adenylyltransferase subunit 1
MERTETDHLELNEIGSVAIQTSKELFFDIYHHNKATGAFVLIDPITNNTSAVGMISAPLTQGDLVGAEDLPVLDLGKLGIAPEHREAVRRAVSELSRQGFQVRVIE